MPSFRRIVIATDFSDGAERALEHAADLAATDAVPLIVLHVMQTTAVLDDDGPWPHREADATAWRARVEERLAGCRERARARHAPEVETAIGRGDPVIEILRIASDRACDLIVLGPHGERGPQARLGSVTERVLQRARAAVLVAARDPGPA